MRPASEEPRVSITGIFGAILIILLGFGEVRAVEPEADEPPNDCAAQLRRAVVSLLRERGPVYQYRQMEIPRNRDTVTSPSDWPHAQRQATRQQQAYLKQEVAKRIRGVATDWPSDWLTFTIGSCGRDTPPPVCAVPTAVVRDLSLDTFQFLSPTHFIHGLLPGLEVKLNDAHLGIGISLRCSEQRPASLEESSSAFDSWTIGQTLYRTQQQFGVPVEVTDLVSARFERMTELERWRSRFLLRDVTPEHLSLEELAMLYVNLERSDRSWHPEGEPMLCEIQHEYNTVLVAFAAPLEKTRKVDVAVFTSEKIVYQVELNIHTEDGAIRAAIPGFTASCIVNGLAAE